MFVSLLYYLKLSCGHYHEFSDCFEYLKKSPIKSSHPQKILTKFPYPQKSSSQKFPTPKNPSIIPVTWNPEYLPLGRYDFMQVLLVISQAQVTKLSFPHGLPLGIMVYSTLQSSVESGQKVSSLSWNLYTVETNCKKICLKFLVMFSYFCGCKVSFTEWASKSQLLSNTLRSC